MRRALFKIHSYLALAVLIPVFLIALTGSILVFKFELDALLMPEAASLANKQYSTTTPSRLSFNSLVATINASYPEYEIGSWEFFDDKHESDRVYLIKKGTEDWYKVYLDPYGNQVLSSPVPLHHDLTDWLLHFHYTLMLNNLWKSSPFIGLLIGLITALSLMILGITGLIVYRKFWRQFFTLNWDKRPKVMTRRLHRFSGIWCSPVLLILGFTGAYFNLFEYLDEVKEHSSVDHHPIMERRLYSEVLNFDEIIKTSTERIQSFTPTYLFFPTEEGRSLVVYGSVNTSNPFSSDYSSRVSFDANTGAYQFDYDIRQQSVLWTILDSFRELHFGNFAGIGSKLVWCLVGIGICFLSGSGLYMWYGRFFNRSKSKRKRKQHRETLPYSPELDA
ncbi:PepSY-associated TM helix domain-containing protein [Marinibactrum halimedae]|uniref:Membrane protein n=1 Tax=Marinibactrum halimedae TaxID=1444977 RepID=A0AA37T913_9GAMM|nr:PepSY-associated TM helix domain-containing protein [Marinibactrum halimedae]MCD9458927.1 PepSY domain-containing protein [Marinibactrum halimedae]GLS27774.1 membrane protein [Marinibactrum halimedae]